MRKNGSTAFQWLQLTGLTTAHFVSDIFPGAFHAILPAVQDRFGFSVARGGLILTIFLLVCNGVQLIVGHLRSGTSKPLFLYIGLTVMGTGGLIGFLPARPDMFWIVTGLLIVCGCGVGFTHPEGLRCVHALGTIAGPTGTAMFMTGGVAGFALGGWASTVLIENYDFTSLCAFGVLSLATMLVVTVLRPQMAVEGRSAAPDTGGNNGCTGGRVSFWPILLMAVLAGISSTVTTWILPQRLRELGFELGFGGLAVMVFSLAGGAGSFFWAALAGRRNPVTCVNLALAAGVPFFVAYSFLIEYKIAVLLLFAASFCSFGAYPLMVAIARHIPGINLGRRMGLIVGGTWLVSSLAPWLLGPVAKHFGPQVLVYCIPAGYILSSLLGFYLVSRWGASAAGIMSATDGKRLEVAGQPLDDKL